VSNIMPKGEKLRQAVKWISDKLKDEPSKRPKDLIGLASERFNLSPKEENFLVSFYEVDKTDK